MSKTETTYTYSFVNPNTPKEFEQIIRNLLLDRLLSSHPHRPPAAR